MLRAILAVIAGYLVFAAASVGLFVVTGREAHEAAPMGFMVLATLWGMAAAAAGGYLAAVVAQRRDLLVQAVLAVIVAAGAVASMFTAPEGADRWSQLAALVLMAPSSLLGGHLWLRRARIGPHPAA